MSDWTFLTNHATVLLCIARDPGLRIRDIAGQVGITERAAQQIVNDLVAAGYVTRTRVGNRNVYTVYPQLPFRVPVMRHREIGGLLALLEEGPDRPTATAPAEEPVSSPRMRARASGEG